MAGFLFLPTTTTSSSLLPTPRPSHHRKPTNPSLPLPSRLHSHPSSPHLSSPETPTKTTTLLTAFATTSCLLLLSLSGPIPLPALAAPPPLPTTQEADREEREEARMYSEMVERRPRDVGALKSALFARMQRREWRGALRCVERLAEVEPREVEWRLMEAQLFELMGELGKAEEVLRGVLEERPLLLRALHGLALCMHKRLEGPAVFEMLEKALQLAHSEERVPDERNIKLLIAQMHVVMGQLDVASEKLQDLINEDHRDFRSHLCLGVVYALLERKEEADEEFEIYGSLVPDEFPHKGFIDDVILSAKLESKDWLQNGFVSEFPYRK